MVTKKKPHSDVYTRQEVSIIRLVHGYSSVVLLPIARDNLILIAAYALALASPLYC